jgi:23S rRNA pseudouridine1911/1915/1917 synthase
MRHERYDALAAHEGMRADAFLASVSEHSRAFIAGLIKQGLIRSGEALLKPSDRVKAGQVFDLSLPEPRQASIRPQPLPIDIVYEDEALAVVNKPRGLAVHPGAGVYDGTMVNALMYRLGSLASVGGEVRPGIVHRLDKDTTGLLLVAKTDPAHRSLSEQLQRREVKREYIALVHGNIAADEGVVDAPIARHPRERTRMAVVSGGRAARTHFAVLHRYGDMTLLRLMLDTGRTHQIRVHMAHIQHPVVHDPVYGTKADRQKGKAQLLHAFRLGFTHPTTGEPKVFTAPLPDDFEAVLRAKGQPVAVE